MQSTVLLRPVLEALRRRGWKGRPVIIHSGDEFLCGHARSGKSLLAAESSSWEKTLPAGRASHWAFCSPGATLALMCCTEDTQQTYVTFKLCQKTHTLAPYLLVSVGLSGPEWAADSLKDGTVALRHQAERHMTKPWSTSASRPCVAWRKCN